MEQKAEKPTLYLITGHRGAGKTSQIMDLLHDHPFTPDVYQFSAQKRRIDALFPTAGIDPDQGILHQKQFEEYAMFVDSRIKYKENIYVEFDFGLHMIDQPRLLRQVGNDYNTRVLFVACDNPEISLQRIKAARPAEQVNDSVVAGQNTFADKYLSAMLFRANQLDVYDGSGDKPKLLLSRENGNLTYVAKEIVDKSWLLPGSELRKVISQHHALEQSKDLKKGIKPDTEIAKPKKKKGMGL